MSCPFDLAHYAEILDAASSGGYAFAHFEGAPAEGTVILRHDVDLSLDAAVRMAEVEHDASASATYFLMTESVFYNLDSSEGVAATDRLRELGHRVALHAVYPNAPLDGRFDPVVAWHNPEIWAYPGDTMGQTMRAMLEAEKERRLQQLADDRIDLS